MATPRPSDEQFRDTYLQQGLQPSVGYVEPVRNVEVEHKNDPTKRRGGNNGVRNIVRTAPIATQVTGTALQAAGTAADKSGAAIRRGSRAAAGVPVVGQAVAAGGTVVGTGVQVAGKGMNASGRLLKKAGGRARAGQNKELRKRAQGMIGATRSNMMIWAWGSWSYFWVQIPFAILNLIFFALAAVSFAITDELQPDPSDGALKKTGKFIVKGIAWLAKKVFDSVSDVINAVTGFDLSATLAAIDPTNLFMLTEIMLIFYAIAVMSIAGLTYLSNGVDSLYGRGAAVKIITFILCFAGYILPLFNFIPWAFFWTLAVQRYPK